MTHSIHDLLLKARILAPYLSRAIGSVIPVERKVTQNGEPTLGVDKSWRLYWSAEALSRWTFDEAAAVILHETLHLVRDHDGRRSGRHPEAWNVSGDLEINDDLSGLPADALLPSLLNYPEGLLAEEYYNRLLSEAQNPQCGCGSGAGGSPLDGELPSGEGPQGLPDGVPEAVRAAVAQDIRDYVQANPGTVPAGLVMWADQVAARPPVQDWKGLLRVALGRGINALTGRTLQTWRRLHRRSGILVDSFGILRPGTVDRLARVAVVVDTSGSMSPYGSRVLGILEEIRKLVTPVAEYGCDAEARKKARGTSWTGGGGTDMREGLKLAEDCDPDIAVLVTDGETPWPDEPTPWPLLVVLVKQTEGLPDWVRCAVPWNE